VAAAEGFQVGPARQRAMDTDEHVTGANRGNGNILDSHVTRSVEDCRLHEVILLLILNLVRAEVLWSLPWVQGVPGLSRRIASWRRNTPHNGYDTAQLCLILAA
jgi:hypothetical protein